MPIRTNRGRAAVYRRLWGWPLRSPRHLVVTLVGLTILAIAIGIVAAHAHGIAAKQQATGGSAVTGSAGGVPTTTATPGGTATGSVSGDAAPSTPVPTDVTRLSGPPDTPVSAPPPPAALDVITTWGRAWVNHPVGMTNAQWLAQLAPYTTQEFLPVMNSVNVANIDATEVTGAPQVTKSYTDSVEAMLPTNAGQLDITAIDTPQGWLVASYTEAS
jgi:hypothetical protein